MASWKQLAQLIDPEAVCKVSPVLLHAGEPAYYIRRGEHGDAYTGFWRSPKGAWKACAKRFEREMLTPRRKVAA